MHDFSLLAKILFIDGKFDSIIILHLERRGFNLERSGPKMRIRLAHRANFLRQHL